jgi:hypothetical protein
MTCNRLERKGLLARLGGELHGHVEQCPDCSARVRGYQRIAGWIAEGKTQHRAPAGWQRRTLARVLAASSPARSSANEPGEVEAPAEVRAPAPQVRHRVRHWSRVVVPLASAAIIAMIVATVLTDGEPPAQSVALRSESPRAMPLGTPPVPPSSPASAQPTEPAVPESEPHANAEQAPWAAVERPDRRSGSAPAAEGATARDERRGGTVTVDWAEGRDPTRPNPSERTELDVLMETIRAARKSGAVIDVVIETVPAGAEVVVGNVILGTTPYRRSLPRDLELVIRLRGYRDVTVAARRITRPVELVPISANGLNNQ